VVVSHQTIRLSKGRHASPVEGACVMELASMLAGEEFSDHPESVCPVIGSFLRAYNDAIDDTRRQDLYRYAAAVVDTRASQGVQDARMARLAAWMIERRDARVRGSRLPWRLRRVGLYRVPSADVLPLRAAQILSRKPEETHPMALALIDELIAIGARRTVRMSRPRTPSNKTARARPSDRDREERRDPGGKAPATEAHRPAAPGRGATGH
jgi:hypothetical protein